jgi:hypothetical protein
MLELERLEDRCAPADLFGFTRVEVQPPPQLVNPTELYVWIKLETFASQWGLGIPWAPGRILQLDLDPTQAAMLGIPNTTARLVLPVGNSWTMPGGTLPVILASPGNYEALDGGIGWEETSLALGWWYQDWGGLKGNFSLNLMPHGPQYGQSFTPPNYELADILLASGNPYWLYFI